MVSVDDVIQGAEVHVLKWKYRSINTESRCLLDSAVCTTGLLQILCVSVCVQRDSVTLSSGSGDFPPLFSIDCWL